jgi:hypothetical protein
MKNLKVAITALTIAGLSLTSCSSDDSSGTAASIVAKWNQTKTVTKVGNSGNITQSYQENEVGCDKDYIEFTANGAVNDVIYFKNATNVCEADLATPTSYTKTDNAMTIAGGEFQGVYEITKLSGSQLIIKSIENVSGNEITTSIYFNKAN